MTQTHTICHCGKCKITCNKHGKRAKCADCGKRRLLGTVINKQQIRHVCDECCEKISLLPPEVIEPNKWDEWEKV